MLTKKYKKRTEQTHTTTTSKGKLHRYNKQNEQVVANNMSILAQYRRNK